MNVFGRLSRQQLETCDSDLQELAHKVLSIKDHSIIKGHRGRDEQNEAFENGYSQLQWPDGRHNRYPSIAMDVQTYPRPEDEQALREDQLYLLGLYKGIASELGIALRTGADWDMDGEIADNGFDDFYHVEIDE